MLGNAQYKAFEYDLAWARAKTSDLRSMDSVNWQRKTESKRRAKDALRAVNEARDYLMEVTSFRGEIPPTRAEFDAAVFEMRELRIEYLGMRALLMAYLEDEPCPQQMFSVWASRPRILEWRNAEKDPLPAVELNGKICVRPSDFFAALKRHGVSSLVGKSGNKLTGH
jgi:hypothetical protein